MSTSEPLHRTRSRYVHAQKRKHNNDNDSNLNFNLGTKLLNDNEAYVLLQSMLIQITPHVWWKSLSLDDDSPDTFAFTSE